MLSLQTDNILPALPDSIPSPAEELSMLKNLSVDDLVTRLAESVIDFAIQVALAILVFYVGKFIIRKIFNITAAILLRRQVDKSLSTFILSLIRIVLYFIVVITVIGILGINTSSFIALFASAGVAVGMALSGTLQNFAGGVLILLLKPYKIGDYIEAQGYAGIVTEIQIFHTIICTYDNKSIIIPNGGLSTGSINNWSREDYRRVQWDVAISYGDNVDVARKAIIALFKTDSRIVQSTIEHDRKVRHEAEAEKTEEDKEEVGEESRRSWFARLIRRRHQRLRQRIEDDENRHRAQLKALKPNTAKGPQVLVDGLGDSSVNLVVRAWVRTIDYWSVFYEYNERIYNTLPQHGISFPFPQMDVHVSNVDTHADGSVDRADD